MPSGSWFILCVKEAGTKGGEGEEEESTQLGSWSRAGTQQALGIAVRTGVPWGPPAPSPTGMSLAALG